MNELSVNVFENEEFGKVRTVVIDGEPWFVGKDVADALGYTNPSKALIDHVDAEDKLNNVSLSSLGQRGGWLVNESGLYSLVLSSRLDSAKRFKHWITSGVLPQIRKTGSYGKQLELPHDYLSALKALVATEEARLALEAKVEEDAPKVLLADHITASDDCISIGSLAKILKQEGVDIGSTRLFQTLRDDGYLMNKRGKSHWNLPTQRSMEMGVMRIKETPYKDGYGRDKINQTPVVTGKGQEFFINKYAKKHI